MKEPKLTKLYLILTIVLSLTIIVSIYESIPKKMYGIVVDKQIMPSRYDPYAIIAVKVNKNILPVRTDLFCFYNNSIGDSVEINYISIGRANSRITKILR